MTVVAWVCVGVGKWLGGLVSRCVSDCMCVCWVRYMVVWVWMSICRWERGGMWMYDMCSVCVDFVVVCREMPVKGLGMWKLGYSFGGGV